MYIYGTEEHRYFVGKTWMCYNHNTPKKCWIPIKETSKCHQRLVTGLSCDFQDITVPESSESGFLSIWYSLNDDEEYLQDLNEIYTKAGFTKWTSIPECHQLRKLRSFCSSNNYIKQINVEKPDHLVTNQSGESQSESNESFRKLFEYMVITYIKKKCENEDKMVNALKNYFSLPDQFVGMYAAHLCDEEFMEALQDMLQIRILILRSSLEHDPLSGRFMPLNDYDTNDYYAKIHSSLFGSDKKFRPLRLILLRRVKQQYHILAPKYTKTPALKLDELPDVILSLFNIDKEKKQPDMDIIEQNSPILSTMWSSDLDEIKNSIMKFKTSRIKPSNVHYASLPSKIARVCMI